MKVYTSQYVVNLGTGLAVIVANTVEEASEVLLKYTGQFVEGLQYEDDGPVYSYQGTNVDDWGKWKMPVENTELTSSSSEAKVLFGVSYQE